MNSPKFWHRNWNTICIQSVRLNNLPLPEEALAGYLAAGEREKAMRRRGEARTAAIAARGLLRVWLGDALGLAPQSLQFVYGEYGKPALAPAQNHLGLCFSVAHSADAVVLAATQGAELGVDIERELPGWPLEEVAPALFSKDVLGDWRSLPPTMRAEAFWQNWVRREACAKVQGIGITQAATWPQCAGSYNVADISIGGGYRAAVAYAGPPRQLQFLHRE